MDRLSLPHRMFAAGEEPLGERINSYHRTRRTEMLIKALEPEELDFLRQSTFGKILDIYENPPFSGAFGQYIIVRLLKDEIALSQSSVAIRGYVEALQLVMIAAVPQLKEEITHNWPVVIVEADSDGETPDEAEPPTELICSAPINNRRPTSSA
ncbi:Uncharacterized protein Rs2_10390 [Raphanus sativus]|nr:Uncharacterized protein Rs2_10390 [Raphanus sativus]